MAPPRKYKVRAGQRFGAWTVVAEAGQLVWGGQPVRAIHVRCDCGTEARVSLYELLEKRSMGCRVCYGVRHQSEITRAALAAGLRPAMVAGRVARGESLAEAVQGPKRNAHALYTVAGFTGSLAAHARRLGISRQAIDDRLTNGWPLEDALTYARSGGRRA